MIGGMDVSYWQSTTPPLTGLGFLVARATYATVPDSRYAMHMGNAEKAGLIAGAYHFGTGTATPADQAAAFLKAAGQRAKFLVLDLESNGNNGPSMTVSQAGLFIAAVKAHDPYHRNILLYHSESGWPGGIGQGGNWVAKWSTSQPSVPFVMWQYQGSPLDRDWYNGTLDGLRALAGIAPTSAGPIIGDEMNAATQVPVAVADIASGGTVYADADRTTQLIASWAGGTSVGVYWRPSVAVDPVTGRANLACVRVDFATGGADFRAVFVGVDKMSNFRTPGQDCSAEVKAATDPLNAKIVSLTAQSSSLNAALSALKAKVQKAIADLS